MRILNRVLSSIYLGPQNCSNQIRWHRKATITARTRLETRVRDPKLDSVALLLRKLKIILSIRSIIPSSSHRSLSLSRLSRFASLIGLDTSVHRPRPFVRKYPHIFRVFYLRRKNKTFFKYTPTFLHLLELERDLLSSQQNEELNALKIKKIVLMSVNGSVHLNSIRLLRSELGLPEDFFKSIIRKYDQEFRVGAWDTVELVDGGEGSRGLGVAAIENWRRKELEEKWLGEFEVNYAFPMYFPIRFIKGPGFKDRLRNWQRLKYVKPYQRKEDVWIRKSDLMERYEKRAVAIIHELLCLTVEKRMPVRLLAHFRKDLDIMLNIRELLLRHPGIFYISTKGVNPMLFLREAYYQWRLIEPNPIHDVRRKMLDLVFLKTRNTTGLLPGKEPKEVLNEETHNNLC